MTSTLTSYAGIALTGVPDWVTIPLVAPGGEGAWALSNEPAGYFPAWAATAGCDGHPHLTRT